MSLIIRKKTIKKNPDQNCEDERYQQIWMIANLCEIILSCMFPGGVRVSGGEWLPVVARRLLGILHDSQLIYSLNLTLNFSYISDPLSFRHSHQQPPALSQMSEGILVE